MVRRTLNRTFPELYLMIVPARMQPVERQGREEIRLKVGQYLEKLASAVIVTSKTLPIMA